MQFPCNSLSLAVAARRVTELYDRMFASLGLTTAQYHLLTVIASIGPVSKDALCRALVLETDALNRGLRPLIHAGWVDVSSSRKVSGRVAIVTAAGRKIAKEGDKRFAEAQAMFDKAIGKRAASEMRDLLHEVINANYGLD